MIFTGGDGNACEAGVPAFGKIPGKWAERICE